MHDIRMIRDEPAAFDAGLARRGMEPMAARILDLDEKRRALTKRMQELQARRKEASKAIGMLKGKRPSREVALSIIGHEYQDRSDTELADILVSEVADIKKELVNLETMDREGADQLSDVLALLPNLPAIDVPKGQGESDNVQKSQWGEKRSFTFEPKEHADLGPALGMDFETGAKMSGARFTFLRGNIARLHRALAQFMLDFQTGERDYIECAPPLLVREEAAFGTGQLPKFSEDLFHTSLRTLSERESISLIGEAMKLVGRTQISADTISQDAELNLAYASLFASEAKRYLIPTAEVSLTNTVREEIISDLTRPMRLTALTPCFRSEAGAAGKDTRGFIRQHQFEKVELVSICRPEDAQSEHKHMVDSAEAILKKLGLPYRRMLLCAGDMGFTSKRTFDLEVWLPGQNAYREISSISWCGDFQARRMNARYRPEGEKKTAFVHTLNGSGLAVGRTLVAVIENYQQEDGSVAVPDVLAPYMGGVDKLTPIDDRSC